MQYFAIIIRKEMVEWRRKGRQKKTLKKQHNQQRNLKKLPKERQERNPIRKKG